MLNAAGSLGFSPHEGGPINLQKLGAFVTNPISMRPRKPAHSTRLLHYASGVLLHTGLANPGFGVTLKRYGARWEEAELPVIVHLLAEQPAQITRMTQRLEELENVMGVELGLPHDVDLEEVATFTKAATGELAVIVRLPLPRVVELAGAAIGAGAEAVSLGPPRGALPLQNGELLQGRLYGPSLFPQALAAVSALTAMGVSVIGGCGVYETGQAEAMLGAGAIGVQLDTVLWRGRWQEEAAQG